MPEVIDQNHQDSIELTLYLLGLGCFIFLLVSALLNYQKNRSYYVGAMSILTIYIILYFLRSYLHELSIDMTFIINNFFPVFGFFMSAAIIFFLLMFGVKVIIEKAT